MERKEKTQNDKKKRKRWGPNMSSRPFIE